MLKRELSKFESYATLIGVMVGAGIFVAIGEAGENTGPATFFAYLVLGPVTLLTALPYVVFGSTPLGNLPGGAYIHITRTFKSYFPGFITMWLNWVTYIGVLCILSISVGNYLEAFWPGGNPRIVATGCLLLFFTVNLFGAKNYGRWQSAMFTILLISIALLVVPGIFAVKAENFTPFFPKGLGGFVTSLSVLFFAYAGFDALAQTAGETKSASKTLPRVFVIGILISVAIYTVVSFVAFGTFPYRELIVSKMPVAHAAQTFLPFGSKIVAVGAIAAFLTTINACMMVPSRLLYAFAEDRVAPRALARLNGRFGTPHISLIVNIVLSLILIWSQTISYLIAITLQSLLILYATECLALVLMPRVNKELWQQVPSKLRKKWVIAGGFIAFVCQVCLYATITNPISLPLVIWTAAGIGFYFYERYRGRLEGFDYKANLAITTLASDMDMQTTVTYESIQHALKRTMEVPKPSILDLDGNKTIIGKEVVKGKISDMPEGPHA